MSPYTLFPSFSFLERVYNDGFRIILYSVKDYKKNYDKFFTHRLFPYEAIYEEDSYVKIRTTQNPSNYVLYYDTKFLEDESYVLRRNETLINNNALVKCRVYDFNIDDLKLELLKVNNFDVKQIQGTIDDLSRNKIINNSSLIGKYEEDLERESAYEILSEKNRIKMEEKQKALEAKEEAKRLKEEERIAKQKQKEEEKKKREEERERKRKMKYVEKTKNRVFSFSLTKILNFFFNKITKRK